MTSDLSNIVFTSGNSALNYSLGGWGSSRLSVSGVSYGVRCTQTPGSTVSLTEEYVSIAIWGFYLPDRNLPSLGVNIDGESIPLQYPPSIEDDPSTWHRWELAYAQPLDKKNHTTELVTYDVSDESPFCFHRIEVMSPTGSSQLIANPNNASSTSTTTTPSTLSSDVPSGSHHLSSTGPLVGAVVGSVAFTLLVCGALFFWWRRSKQHRYRRTSLDDESRSGRSTSPNRQGSFSSRISNFFYPSRMQRRKRASSGWIETRPPVSHSVILPQPSSPVSMETPWLDAKINDDKASFVSEHSAHPSDLGLGSTIDLTRKKEWGSLKHHHDPTRGASPEPLDDVTSPMRSHTT